MRRDICAVLFLFCLLGIGLPLSDADEVEISAVVTEFPVAILADANSNIHPVGVLERGSATYNIYAPGIGFKVGDTFTVDNTTGAYAVIFLNKKRTSVVRLEAGAKIVFLSSGNIDAYDVAITGIYIENDLSNTDTYTLAQFDINTASSAQNFLVYTPSAVVGVQGTRFNIKVPKSGDTASDVQIYPFSHVASKNDLYVFIYNINQIRSLKFNSSLVITHGNIKNILATISNCNRYLNIGSLIATGSMASLSAAFQIDASGFKAFIKQNRIIHVNAYSHSVVLQANATASALGGPYQVESALSAAKVSMPTFMNQYNTNPPFTTITAATTGSGASGDGSGGCSW